MMEEYEDVENDASGASGATATAGHEHDVLHQALQIARQLELESERNQSANLGVLKATSGNATKRLKMRQETRAATRTTKTAEAAMKQIATQELQVEKGRMQEWKQNVMLEVTRELQVIKQAQEVVMEAQRESFQVELERIREKLQMVETRSVGLENEIKTLKAQKQMPEKRTAQTTPIAGKVPTVPSSSKSTEGEKATSTPPKSYAQIAAIKDTSEKAWIEVTSSNRKRKSNPSDLPKLEPEKRRMIFRRESISPRKSEADLMLVLNESLQRAGIPAYIRFSRVGYFQLGAISALLTEKPNAENLIKGYANMLIRTAKSVNEGVIGADALERWQRLKVHGISLTQYLGEGRMELLWQKIESSTEIKLKTLPHLLINKTQLEERLDFGNRKGSAIVITVEKSMEASRLNSKRLRFDGALKVVEKYWKAGPSSVCMTCSGIGHN